MAVLGWLHLVGAALWVGALITLAMAVLVAVLTMPRELFRSFMRHAGWAFAAVSAGGQRVLVTDQSRVHPGLLRSH